ncbi:MAG: DUF5916 domain-containing protein [Candidatus Polarisedimenticolia bacterium]
MRSQHRVVLALWLGCLAGAAFGQDPNTPTQTPPPAAKGDATRTTPHRVPRAASPVKVDGLLDEPVWQEALKLELPWEVSPADNVPAAVTTQALLLYDDGYLYAAFRSQDPDPSAIRARLSDRDRAFQDDFVGIVIDTFNDERRAFEFFVNPLGVQMDLVQDDVNGTEDESWDAIWDSAGRVTEGGYDVEMAIPYTSLRFQKGSSDQVWGLDIVRAHPRDLRRLLALQPRDRNVSCYLCQVQKIVGFSGAEPGRNLEVSPTLTSVRTDAWGQDPADTDTFGEMESGDPDTDLGVTARWGMTPNLTASGTINPDFSQVEADAAQLDVNEQFALFFPEKRPFFMEGADFFNTPLRAVHTRTVADPDWGAKLSGKEGRHALGAFVANDAITNLLIPGPQSSSSLSLENQEVTDAVLRYRMDMGKNSTLGAVFTGRSGGGYESWLTGVDALMRLTDTDTIRAQLLGSQTTYPDDPNLGLSTDTLDDRAFLVNYDHFTRNWGTWARYSDLGPDFRADMGFIPQVGIRLPVAGAERYWIGSKDTWYSRINAGGDFDQTVDSEGILIEREFEGWSNVQGPMQSYLSLGGGQRLRGFRDDVFDQNFVNFYGEFQPASWTIVSLDAGVSHRVDFEFEDPADPGAARQGFETRVAPWSRFHLGRRVRLELSHNYRTLENDDGYLFRANLSQLNLVYQLTLRAFFRAIVQVSDVRFNMDQYAGQCADPAFSCPTERARDTFAQLLFSYKINPQSVLFLGYTDTRAGALPPVDPLGDESLQRIDRTFFAKVGYAWVF